MKKNGVLFVVLFVLVLLTGCKGGAKVAPPALYETQREEMTKGEEEKELKELSLGNLRCNFFAKGEHFFLKKGDDFKEIKLCGINLGLSLPGSDAKNPNISYETYYRWFEEMSNMNVNVVRIYTRHPNAFYEALYDFNQTQEKKLYFMQGIWMEEGTLEINYEDALNEKFKDSIRRQVDLVHGKGEGAVDVSDYLIGWCLGVEWNPAFILSVNESVKNPYQGVYFRSGENAQGFEILLSELCDELVEYEVEEYVFQAPVGVLNWSTTDPLVHELEPHENEDMAWFSMENLLANESFVAGRYAVYHVYPWYPEFISLDERYAGYIDKTGENNPFEAYVAHLYSIHNMPVIIGEFGISTSKGMAHRQLNGEYTHGGTEERLQGEYLKNMITSVFDAGPCGAILFSWQDEWFKPTWNTVSDKEYNKYWYDALSAEQSFGIIAMEPFKARNCYLDGEDSEWGEEEVVFHDSHAKMSVKMDEGYLYLMVKLKEGNFEDGTWYLPIGFDLDCGVAESKEEGISFNRKAQFLLKIRGKENSELLVSSDYNKYRYLYGEEQSEKEWDEIYLKLCDEFSVDGKKYPEQREQISSLVFGVTNPYSEEYCSLADYCFFGNCLEVRIPWGMLNFTAPSHAKVMTPFDFSDSKRESSGTKIDGFYLGVSNGNKAEKISMEWVELVPWKAEVHFQERKKAAYEVVREVFSFYQS